MMNELREYCRTCPLLTDDDAPRVMRAAEELKDTDEQLCPDDWVLVQSVADTLSAVRVGRQAHAFRVKASVLPVAKRETAGAGGGRYYWRVRYRAAGDDKATYTVAASTDFRGRERPGDKAAARRRAETLLAEGCVPLELVPPDFDPCAERDEYTENRAPSQPAGMTVRQRTKKH